MTPRQRFICALNRTPLTGRVPHFELAFYLTMEAFRRVHPLHRHFRQWDQMGERERRLHLEDVAEVYIATAERFEHSAISVFPSTGMRDELMRLLDVIREKSGERYCLVAHGDATFEIPPGDKMQELAYRIADDPEGLKREAQAMVDTELRRAEPLAKQGYLDGFILCRDYCLNTGPFLSPLQFGEFIAPYLDRLIRAYRAMGLYTIKHTDGNVMPIIEQLVQCNPHALHSLDPQAGVDIAETKRKYGHRVCLIGNVNCGLLDTGSDDECIDNARYALKHGMPGGGYVFSTSNCIYTGMRMERYELILDVWRKHGEYPQIWQDPARPQ